MFLPLPPGEDGVRAASRGCALRETRTPVARPLLCAVGGVRGRQRRHGAPGPAWWKPAGRRRDRLTERGFVPATRERPTLGAVGGTDCRAERGGKRRVGDCVAIIHTDAGAEPDRDATTELRSVRPARALRRRAGLLDLHGPGRRQPGEHRALLRGAARCSDGAQPVDRDDTAGRRPGVASASADSLTIGLGRGPTRVICIMT